jgi:ABC-type antimicrobial peptide transport system permease subunit
MVGLSKKGLIFMVIVQSGLFVLPAVFMGFLMSIPALNVFSYVMYQKLNLEVSPMLTKNAIGQALFIGIVIPLLSSVIPIRVALRKNLNDALDYQRSKV